MKQTSLLSVSPGAAGQRLVVEEIVEQGSRVWLLISVAQELLLENIARIFLEQLAEIGLDYWIRSCSADVNRNPIGRRSGNCLTQNSVGGIHSRKCLSPRSRGRVDFGHYLKIKTAPGSNRARSGSRSKRRNGSIEVVDARALRRGRHVGAHGLNNRPTLRAGNGFKSTDFGGEVEAWQASYCRLRPVR